MSRNLKVLFFVFAVLVIGGSTYAFAASNTVEASAGGYAGTTVPGYTVTNLVYNLDSTDPSMVDEITFDISPTTGSAAAVLVKLQTATAGAWTSCTLVAGVAPAEAATCTYGTLALADVTALNIVASSTIDP